MLKFRSVPTAAELRKEIDDIITRARDGEPVEEIAAALKRHTRHVTEVLRVETQGSDSVKAAIRVPTSNGGLLVRVAARLVQLDPAQQDDLLPQIRGLRLDEAIQIIRGLESRARPGPRPSEFGRPKDVLRTCAELDAVASKLLLEKAGQTKERARVLTLVLGCLRGEVGVGDVHDQLISALRLGSPISPRPNAAKAKPPKVVGRRRTKH